MIFSNIYGRNKKNFENIINVDAKLIINIKDEKAKVDLNTFLGKIKKLYDDSNVNKNKHEYEIVQKIISEPEYDNEVKFLLYDAVHKYITSLKTKISFLRTNSQKILDQLSDSIRSSQDTIY